MKKECPLTGWKRPWMFWQAEVPKTWFKPTQEVELFADGTVALGRRLTYLIPGAWRQLLRLAGVEVRASDVIRDKYIL